MHSPAIYILLSAGGNKRRCLIFIVSSYKTQHHRERNKKQHTAFPFRIIFLKPPNAQQGVSTSTYIENKLYETGPQAEWVPRNHLPSVCVYVKVVAHKSCQMMAFKETCARAYNLIYFGVSLSFLRKLTAADDTLLLLPLRGVCVVTKIWNSCDCCISFTHTHTIICRLKVDVHHNIVCLFTNWTRVSKIATQDIARKFYDNNHLGENFVFIYLTLFSLKIQNACKELDLFLMVQSFGRKKILCREQEQYSIHQQNSG